VSRLEAWLVWVATVAVGGTGLVYAWMRYLVVPADPWAVVNHPWQPAVQHLHVLTAPLLVFAAGIIWREHVWKGFRKVPSRRSSGITTALTLLPMIASGYLLQTAVEPAWRTAWLIVHLLASGLWLLGLAAHALVARLARRRGAGDAWAPPAREGS
jgi:hypothetical protein